MKITGIQRFSTNDGPGIRTLVYFAGCAMRCQWCQNPEAQRMVPDLMIEEDRCIGCKACAKVCPENICVFLSSGEPFTNRQACIGCMKCTEVCFSGARHSSIKDISVEELMKEVLKDKEFYDSSGGGLTLSGGETVLNSKECAAVLKTAKENGIHTAVETAGCYDEKCLDEILPYVDLFLFDLKMMDKDKHLFYTGVDNEIIKSNFLKAAAARPTILRVALIPEVNDGDEFKKIIDFVKENTSIREVHILPFHQLGDSKYTQLAREYKMAGKSTDNDENIKLCSDYAESAGFGVSVGGYGIKKEG